MRVASSAQNISGLRTHAGVCILQCRQESRDDSGIVDISQTPGDDKAHIGIRIFESFQQNWERKRAQSAQRLRCFKSYPHLLLFSEDRQKAWNGSVVADLAQGFDGGVAYLLRWMHAYCRVRI